MSFWLTVAGMVAVTFGSRYAGLALRTDLPDFWVRFLHFVPIAVFAALVTPYLEGDLGEWGIRVTAAAVAVFAAWRTRQLWVAIAVGMVLAAFLFIRRMANVTNVTGIRRASPPILRTSCSPPRAWITLPAPRKRQALKKAWVTRWKIATP